jgi:hypothetical protein
MKLLKWFLVLSLVAGLSVPSARAVVDVSSNELQAAADILLPNADSLGLLKGYSAFHLEEKSSMTGGLSARYKALLLADPWFDSELPEIQLILYSYSSQEAAKASFESLSNSGDFSNGEKTVLSEDSHSLYYQSNFGGSGVDVLNSIDAEYRALHLLEWNGNILLQASLFRQDGEYNEVNLQAFADAIAKTDEVQTLLTGALDNIKLAMGLLFPPSESYWSSQSEKSSYDLSNTFHIPTHGTIHLKIYVTTPSAAVGTILDSSGLSSPTDGDLYLYINSAGRLFAGIYAPNFDANCTQEAGWYRLETNSSLYPYEWNSIDLHYGVGGFSVALNGEEETSCSVSQPRSSNVLYLGDYPNDSIAESMIGTVGYLSTESSKTDTGQEWDDVLTEHLFLDLEDTDPDLAIFQYLKTKKVFLGSDGMLYPDAILNRAQMVKVVLRAFNRNADAGALAPFWDVPVDAWYRKYIAKAYKEGIVSGHDNGTFLPGHDINRAEFLAMLYRIDGSKRLSYEEGTYADVSEDDWFALGAAYAASKGLYPGALLDPSAFVTRREAAHILYALMNE